MTRTLKILAIGVLLVIGESQKADGQPPVGSPPTPLAGLGRQELRRPSLNLTHSVPPLLTVPSSIEHNQHVSKNRLAIWAGLTAGAGYLAYEQSQASWGLSNGQFHFKDDLNDGLALSDETSHMFAAFHLTRALNTGYAWTGMSSTSARRLAAVHAWIWTFLVEYPIDAFNPTQGFGMSDVAFNTVGVFVAYQHTRPGSRPWWDIKISVKESFFEGENRFIAHSNEQYDDYIYWFTVRPLRHRYVPLWLGAGYSTTHREWPGIDKELHLAVGTTIEDLAALIDESAAVYLRPLNFFYLNLGAKLVWD